MTFKDGDRGHLGEHNSIDGRLDALEALPPGTSDPAVAGFIGDPTSATATALSATIGAATKDHGTDLGQFEMQPMVAIGHSYIGQDNQTVGARLHERIASRLRMGAITNFGDPGQYSRTVAMNTMAGTKRWVPRTRAMFLGLCTINDIQLLGDAANAFTGYKSAWRALLSFVTANAAIPANTDSFVYTSGWSRVTVAGLTHDTATGGQYLTTSTVGEYFEFTFTGTAVDVVMISKVVAGGIVTFTEGATTLGTLDMTAPCADNTPTIFRVRGRAAGTHTIRGTLTSGAFVFLDSIRIPALQPVSGIVIGEALPNRVAPGSTPYATLLTQYKTALQAIVAEYPSMVYVDAAPGWDQTAMLNDDGTHPNDYGCAHYATAAIAALSNAPYSAGVNKLTAVEPAYVSPAGPSIPSGGFSGAAAITGGTFRDNFNRADSTTIGTLETGQTWSIAGASTTWAIASNMVGAATGGNSLLNVDTSLADGTVLGVVGAANGINAGLAFRAVDEANMWYVVFGGVSDTYYHLVSRSSGAPTTVADTTINPTVGDVVEVILAGTSIKVNVNGVQVMAYTSATRQTATKHGMYGNGGLAPNSRWNAWKFTP